MVTPGIDTDPRVCGGDPCIIHTRIPVWVLVQSKRLGMSEADILKSYPTLRAEDLVNAWAYAQSHREEIDRQIVANEEASVLSQLAFHGIRHRTGLATSDELRRVANAALDAGVYAPSLADAALWKEERLDEIGPAFQNALMELHIALPGSQDECCWALLRHYVSQIASGAISPREGLRGLMVDVYYRFDLHAQTTHYVGDSHDIESLVGAYYGYDDLLERPSEVSYQGLYGGNALAAFDANVVAECIAWLKSHPA